jgi:hypothetical protein
MQVMPQFTLRLTPVIRAALERAAEAEHRSVSSLVRKILVEWLQRRRPT